MKKGIRYILISLLAALFFGLLFYSVQYTSNEGFNPTDEGVIIAQSYRLLQGEIPHRDFISIRPVFSGVLHSIHFISPLPLVNSGRWFVIFEFFLFSFLWVFILLKNGAGSITRKPDTLLFLCAATWCFLLNMNTYNLYPWTTIDALFFSIISFAFFSASLNSKVKGLNLAFQLTASLFFMALAALCRQSFILPFIWVALLSAIVLMRRRRFLLLFPVLLAGTLPLIAYAVFLVDTGAWESFKHQMTGRTELFDTGIIRYIKSFLKARMLPLNFILITVYFILTFMKRSSIRGLPSALRRQLNGRNKGMWQVFVITYSSTFLLCSFLFFAFKEYKIIPFEFFWMFVSLMVPAMYLRLLDVPTRITLLFALLIAWTSSISLGDNFPVFAAGILASGVAYLLYVIVSKLELISFPSLAWNNKLETLAQYAWRFRLKELLLVIVTLTLLGVSINGQRNFNYRDRASIYLTKDLGSLFPAFGEIKTNPNTFAYFEDFRHLYDSLPGIKDHFAMLPNNAMIYPVTGSRNPLPLDWVQGNEYVGAKPQFYGCLNEALAKDTVYFLLDKYESKNMAWALIPMSWPDDLYGYIDIIRKKCVKICESAHFEVWKTKN
ncbi:MAG: hypothetical protein WCM76_08970 [Bacteroidota bacterium]